MLYEVITYSQQITRPGCHALRGIADFGFVSLLGVTVQVIDRNAVNLIKGALRLFSYNFV